MADHTTREPASGDPRTAQDGPPRTEPDEAGVDAVGVEDDPMSPGAKIARDEPAPEPNEPG